MSRLPVGSSDLDGRIDNTLPVSEGSSQIANNALKVTGQDVHRLRTHANGILDDLNGQTRVSLDMNANAGSHRIDVGVKFLICDAASCGSVGLKEPSIRSERSGRS